MSQGRAIKKTKWTRRSVKVCLMNFSEYMQVSNMASFMYVSFSVSFRLVMLNILYKEDSHSLEKKKRLKLSKFVSHCNFCGLFRRKCFCMKECYEKVRQQLTRPFSKQCMISLPFNTVFLTFVNLSCLSLLFAKVVFHFRLPKFSKNCCNSCMYGILWCLKHRRWHGA